MSTKWGVDGKIKISDNPVLEVRGWTLEMSQEPIEDTVMGDTWRTFIPDSGLKSWNATLNVLYDENDATGQEAATIGATVAVKFMAEGDSSGDTYYSGSGIIEGVGVEVPHDALITRRITIRGNGALSKTTV